MKTERVWRTQRKESPLNQKNQYTNELTEVEAACTVLFCTTRGPTAERKVGHMSPTLNQKQPLINRHLQIKFSFLQGSLKLLLPSYCLPNTRGTLKADSIASIKLPCLIILCQSFSLKRTFYFIFNFNILIYIFFISLFTLQVFCIYIITSSLLCLWDS